MGYWLYMTAVTLLVPVIIICVGNAFRRTPPKNSDSLLGYKTKMSVINQDTWEFSNLYFGKLAFRWGWIMLVATVLIMALTFYRSKQIITTAGLITIFTQAIPPLCFFPAVEYKLKKTFHPDGSRK